MAVLLSFFLHYLIHITHSISTHTHTYTYTHTEWENLDSGLLLLVHLVIKLAACHPHSLRLHQDVNARLMAELRSKSAEYIVEGAKDDARSGIGYHASNPDLYRHMAEWGRNQLGHACTIVALHLSIDGS